MSNELEYINAWALNEKQHFEDGDYEWICDKMRQIPFDKPINRILEIGCGAGYSTLTFVLRDFDVISIDLNVEAILVTKRLIESHDYIPAEKSVQFIQADIVHNFKQIRAEIEIHPIDIIVLCNPGGNTDLTLTEQEKKWLDWGNFTEEEYVRENLNRLHTYAMLYASCGLAHLVNTPILIVMRDVYEEIENTLNGISVDTGLRLMSKCLRQINGSPDGGIRLSGNSDNQIYWGMGLYFP